MQHFLDGGRDSDEHRPADDAVPDVQLDQVRHGEERGNVFVIQTVPGIHPQSQVMSLARGVDEPAQFPAPVGPACEGIGIGAGVQFDELGADLRPRPPGAGPAQ